MTPELHEKLQGIYNSVLVIDIETSSRNPVTKEYIDITNFDDYIRYARAKWFGAYSYKYKRYIIDTVKGNETQIRKLFREHDVIVGFNHEEFDMPIIRNNNLVSAEYRPLNIDCLQILGSSSFSRHDGLPFKNRGTLMNYKFNKNNLRHMAQIMKLPVLKGDIDYQIFYKDDWNDKEKILIHKYLEADIEVTKSMFEKLWNFWFPFTEFLSEKNVLNLSWIKSSIASLTYRAACNTLNIEETFGNYDPESTRKESMGGRVLEPVQQECEDVWYVDYSSLYPHIFILFNLFNEVDPKKCKDDDDRIIWHGNDVFKVKGYYDISHGHVLCQDVQEKIRTRIRLKDTDPDNPMIYAIKIFLNSLYGAARSPIFEQIHTENCGWDCCWLGQQINIILEQKMRNYGFEVLYGDTDSLFLCIKDKSKSNALYVKSCLQNVVSYIMNNTPFKSDTFNIDIEDHINYIMWPFNLQPVQDINGKNVKDPKGRLIKELKGKKKTYVYVNNNGENIVYKGLPITETNGSPLGKLILKKYIEPMIFNTKSALFDEQVINDLVDLELKNFDNIALLAREYRVKPAKQYKKDSQIQAQISNGYFNGGSGVISLIKNKKFGHAGKTWKYATVQEILDNNVFISDIDLSKLHNELADFVRK